MKTERVVANNIWVWSKWKCIRVPSRPWAHRHSMSLLFLSRFTKEH